MVITIEKIYLLIIIIGDWNNDVIDGKVFFY